MFGFIACHTPIFSRGKFFDATGSDQQHVRSAHKYAYPVYSRLLRQRQYWSCSVFRQKTENNSFCLIYAIVYLISQFLWPSV